jgi:glycosyltransferase involved in cell wall biosynthesis
MSPKVSVVLSAYNPHYLRFAVESILKQSFTDFEFIIIDDSVDEAVPAMLQDYAVQDARIILSRNQHNLGQTPSLNKGLALAQGQYIARQDDDDISLPDRFAEQVAFLDAQPQVGVVGTQVDIIDTQGDTLDGSGFFYPEVRGSAIQQKLLVDCCLCHGSVMMRRVLVNTVNGYDLTMAPAEDYDLWLRLTDQTQIYRLASHLYKFRYYPDSVSAKQTSLQLLRKAEALERALSRKFGPVPPRTIAMPLGRHYLRAAVSNYVNGNILATKQCLSRALFYAPEIFNPIETYVPFPSAEDGFTFAESVLADLPATRRYSRVSNRLRSRLHMRQVFEGIETGDASVVEAHLWPGLRLDPSWLFNKGVLSISMRSVWKRIRSGVR